MLETAISETHSQNPAPLPTQRAIEPANDRDGSAALWCAVIDRAIEDACGKGLQGTPVERSRGQAEARRWLLERNRGFLLVCEFAGLEPGQVQREARAAMGLIGATGL